MNATPQTRKREFTGRHMLVLMVAFFGVIIAVNVTMATMASLSWTGLVVRNSYVASQEFETKRIAHEAQRAAGWQSSFGYTPGTAELLVRDATGAPVELGPVTLQLNRPVGGHDDVKLTLEQSADGFYRAAVTLADGVWDARATATTATGPFELHERFKVKGSAQ